MVHKPGAIFMVLVSAILSACVCATAGINADHKAAIHVLPHESRSCTQNSPSIGACGDIVTTYAGCGDIDFFLVFYDLVRWQGMEYGLWWPPEWGECVYTKCAGDLFIGDIAASGDGLAAACFECQYSEIVIAGFAWVTAETPGVVCPVLSPCPTAPHLGVGDCDEFGAELEFSRCAFCAGVCGAVGDDPCGPSDVEPATWSKIKSMFR